MLRWCLALVATLAACGDNLLTDAEQAFQDLALPALQHSCASCHAQPEFPFLAGDTPAEIRETLLASGVVDVERPTRSAIFSKGLHSGPPFNVTQVRAILLWLEAERDAY